MKKKLALIVALVLVCISTFVLLAACKDPSGPSGNGGNTTVTHEYVDGVCKICGNSIASTATEGSNTWEKEHTIRFTSTQGQRLQTPMAIAKQRFEEKYPGWTIEYTFKSGSYETLRDDTIADLQTSDYPDVVLCYPDHVANYMLTKKVVDLSKYVYSKDTITVGEGKKQDVGYTEAQIADFFPGFWAEGLAESFADYARYGYTDDTIFTLPFAKSTELMFYNKTILDKEGIAVPKTWDELWAACAKLSAKYTDCVPLGYDSESNWFITMCKQNGWGYTTAAGNSSDHYKFYNSDVINWLQDMQAYYKNAYFITKQLYDPSGSQYTSALFAKSTDGGAFFCIGSSAGASNQVITNGEEVGVAHIPGSKYTVQGREITDNSVISQGPSVVMFRSNGSNADEKEYMTYLFIKELLEPDFQSQYSQASGYSPVRTSTFEIPSYKAAIEAGKSGSGSTVNKAIYIASTMTADFFTSPAFVGSSTARDVVGNLFMTVMKGATDIEGEVKAAIKKCGGVI